MSEKEPDWWEEQVMQIERRSVYKKRLETILRSQPDNCSLFLTLLNGLKLGLSKDEQYRREASLDFWEIHDEWTDGHSDDCKNANPENNNLDFF